MDPYKMYQYKDNLYFKYKYDYFLYHRHILKYIDSIVETSYTGYFYSKHFIDDQSKYQYSKDKKKQLKYSQHIKLVAVPKSFIEKNKLKEIIITKKKK